MNQRIQPAATPYTTPVVSTTNPKDWYIFFQFTYQGEVYERKLRKGINRFHDLKERKSEAEGLRQATEDKLKLGWNPIIDPEFKARHVSTESDLKKMTFPQALKYALEKKKPELAKKSFLGYRSILNMIIDKSKETGHAFVPVGMVTRLHVLELMQRLSEDRGMSNHRYNMFLGVIRSLYSKLEEWTIAEYNPASKIKQKEVAESDFYASYTEAEKIAISNYLPKHHYQLFVFMQVIYHTGIRPKELLLLRNNNIDLKRKLITIVPDFTEETTKTNFIRQIPIPNVLFPFFSEMCLDKYPPEFYVFGSPFEPGKGNRGGGTYKRPRDQAKGKGHVSGISGAMRPDYMKPSPYKAKRDTVGRLWKKLVKEDLKINKCLYAAKHTGGDDKILAGVDLDALRNMYGHRNKRMTERYAKQVKEMYFGAIRSQTPAFVTAKVRKIS